MLARDKSHLANYLRHVGHGLLLETVGFGLGLAVRRVASLGEQRLPHFGQVGLSAQPDFGRDHPAPCVATGGLLGGAFGVLIGVGRLSYRAFGK